MISESLKTIYSKACGKVLIAGGYGVLERQNIGLTLALENYFYCKLEHISSNQETLISVESPQINKKYRYFFNSASQKLQQANSLQNIFVQNALQFSLQYFKILENSGHLKITLVFDKGFISQDSQQNNTSKFISYSQNYSKTGLGSSACVVVSIVSAICALMGQKQDARLINVISQVANLSAQKKIGSNFDISTAVFGTHLYKNLLPQVAFSCIQDKNWVKLLEIDPQVQNLHNVSDLIRNDSIGFIIDVSRGANTRVMVSNFLKNLRAESESVQKEFFTQSKLITQSLYDTICKNSQQTSETVNHMKQINLSHRKLQEKYSRITKTPVQPEEFQGFLDELMEDENIFYVICPGSGGFDALFMLASNKKTQQYYQELIENTRKKYENQLGQGVDFKLKRVNIKWENQMPVSNQDIAQIEAILHTYQNTQ